MSVYILNLSNEFSALLLDIFIQAFKGMPIWYFSLGKDFEFAISPWAFVAGILCLAFKKIFKGFNSL